MAHVPCPIGAFLEVTHRLLVFTAIQRHHLEPKNAVRFLKAHPDHVKALSAELEAASEIRNRPLRLMLGSNLDCSMMMSANRLSRFWRLTRRQPICPSFSDRRFKPVDPLLREVIIVLTLSLLPPVL